MVLVEKLYNIKKRVLSMYKRYLTVDGLYDCILPDKVYIEKLYQKRTGKKLNLKNPRTFNEKINWIKLYDRKPEYTVMADKYLARKFIAERIGEEYLVPLIGVWSSPDVIDFSSLPDEFVLKCNHDNGVIICTDKSKLDIEKTKNDLTFRLERNYYKKLREWPYKNIPRRIICEKYMVPANNEEPLDYKIFCFNGKAKLVGIYGNRFTGQLKKTFYNLEWENVQITENCTVDDIYKKPECFDKMLEIAETLSSGVPMLRVDFNIWQNMLAVGELTFFHHGGMLAFYDEWELKMGDWIELPKKRRR